MTKTIKALLAGVFLAFLTVTCLKAQNGIIVTPHTQTICLPDSATLTATLPNTPAGTPLTLSDDQYSGVINIGFSFTYFGNTYTQCLISSNNYITFNLTGAGGFSPWTISAAIPSASDPTNSIMCPWQDLLPPSGGTIEYATYGTAPNRVFVVSYCSVAMFSCTTLNFTSQIHLYETTNIIETHITNKPLCTTWNGGNAIHGIQDATGTIAYPVPGRNYPTQWVTTYEGYRWTPTGTNTYSQGFIPFAPFYMNSITGPINWYVGTTLVGTGNTITVHPTTTTTYTATVNSSCAGITSDTGQVIVTQVVPSTTSTPSSCSGNNGTASVTATGGTGPYTYSWSPSGGNGATATGLAAGTYTVFVNDAGGCRGQSTVVVGNSGGLSGSVTSTTNATCNAVCNGSITVSAVGGTAPFTYSWSPSGGTAATANGLCSGTYSCTITDANGCVTVQSSTITQPAVLTSSQAQTNVTCNGGSDGTATVTPSGGTANYTYSWSPSGGTAATATGLSPGSYTCAVTDANGCTTSQTLTITQPSALAATPSSTNILCNGGNTGSASVAVTGGTGTYTYSWTPSGGTAATASGLTAGTYTCAITDANGCTTSQTFTLTQPATALSAVPSTTPASCSNTTNGTASVVVSGGTGTYTYSWSPSGGAAATANGLTPGTYTCNITDANGCPLAQTITVTGPTAVTGVPSMTGATCNLSNGSASVNASGGAGNYTYSWSPSGGTASTATGLAPGTYTCTITDANGCTGTANITVTNTGTLPVAGITPSGPTTFCNPGSVTLTGTGGTTYSWSTSATTATITTNTSGTYTVTATNACGSDTATVTVTALSLPNPVVTGQTGFCAGDSTLLTATGGVTYSWSNGQTGATTYADTSGTYAVSATNSCGTTTVTYMVTSTSVVASFSSNVTTGNAPLAVIFTDHSSPSASTWSWNFGDNSTGVLSQNSTHTFNTPGTYTVTLTVSTAGGCTSQITEIIIVTEEPSFLIVPNVFTPNGDNQNAEFKVMSQAISQFRADIYDRWGEMMAEINDVKTGWDGKTKSGALATAGTYYYVISASGSDGKKYDLKGFLNLIR